MLTRRAVPLVILLLLVGLAFRLGRAGRLWERNRYFLAYNRLMNPAGGSPQAEAFWLETATVEADCLQQNVDLITGQRPNPEQPALPAEIDCARIAAVIGNEPVSFSPLALQATTRLYQRAGGQMEMRNNGAAWAYVYVREDGRYRLSLRARCIGPAPAQVRLVVGGQVLDFAYQETAETHSAVFSWAAGHQPIVIFYLNDVAGAAGDRNLRLIEISIEPENS